MTAFLTFLRVFWKPLALIAIGLVILFALRHYGDVRYRTGRADEKAVWLPVQAAAEKALAEANARTATLESAQTAATKAAEARYADQIQTLSQRAVGADQRIAGLLRKLSTVNSCRQQLPEVAGSQPSDAGTAESEGRLAEAGRGIAAVGRDCSSDAVRLEFWVNWYREQSALRAVSTQTGDTP